MKKNLTGMTDEEIVAEYRISGNERCVEILLSRYEKMIAHNTRCFFERNTTKEDLHQEGRIGFFKAIRDYKQEKGLRFCTFAQWCVKCQYSTAIRTSRRIKHQFLNEAVSLDKLIALDRSDGKRGTLIDFVSDNEENGPADEFFKKEDFKFFQNIMHSLLTNNDYMIFMEYIQGKSYQEIVAAAGSNTKSVDNALQRIRHKLRYYFSTHPYLTLGMFQHYLQKQQYRLYLLQGDFSDAQDE